METYVLLCVTDTGLGFVKGRQIPLQRGHVERQLVICEINDDTDLPGRGQKQLSRHHWEVDRRIVRGKDALIKTLVPHPARSAKGGTPGKNLLTMSPR